MKRRYFIVCVWLALGLAVPAHAEPTDPEPHVLIAAIQTADIGAAGHDFALLYNPTAEAVDVTGWKLQYRSAGADDSSGWTTKRTIGCTDVVAECVVTLGPHASMAVSTYDMAGLPNQPMASGFSDTGGQVRLARPAADTSAFETVDMVGYGTAVVAEGDKPAVAPQPGQALLRKLDASQQPIDTDVNAQDFEAGCYDVPNDPQPLAVLKACPESDNEGDNTPTAGGAAGSTQDPQTPITYAPLRITELLPDPASPAQDSTDEFIELYNPTASDVDATDYVIQTGANFSYHYALSGVTVPANGYVAIYSADSHLSLTNSGTAVRLNDPAGGAVDEVASYGTAKTGESWALTANGWQWTTSPTPGAANVLTAAAAPVKVAAVTAATIKKATTSTKKAAATTKTATPKAATTKTAKTVAAKSSGSSTASKPEPNNTLNYLLLATVGLGAAGYGAYEYRHELSRFGTGVWRTITRRKSAPAEEPTPQMD